MQSLPDFLDSFEGDGPEKKLFVCNRTEPDPVQRLFETAFGEQVTVGEQDLAGAEEDTVILVSGDEVLASSSLQRVMDSFLMINSDLYRTSVKGIDEYRLPDVLARMDEEVLLLRGYPASNKEKLLLIAISRYIESLALKHDRGRLDASFQRISRLDDEYGTRRVYEMLADSAVDVHTYGVSGGDWTAEAGLGVTVHTGDSEPYRRSWIVVYDDGSDDPEASAALVAWEVDANVWRSVWTFDPERVREVQRYVVENL